jgi:hypothetical protein
VGRGLCLLHANCQGDPLADLLRAHADFSRAYEISQYVNYARQAVPADELARCDLFLHQWLDEKWGNLSSPALTAKLSPSCRTLCLPNLYCLQYWPFLDSNPAIDYSDAFLNRLLDQGLSLREIVHVYTRGDLRRYFDLPALFAASWDREYEKERRWDVKATDLARSLFRSERLFNTVNHPNRRLTLHVAQETLRLLGFPPLPESTVHDFRDPFPEFELPIHPQVARLQGLEFADEDTRYTLYGRPATFREYVTFYLDCRAHGERDFIGYLRAKAQPIP